MSSKKLKDYSFECVYCDPKLEMYFTTTKEAMFKHCLFAHNVEEQIAKKYYPESSININELPDINLAQIFENLHWIERLKIEQVCKKWHCVGKNLGWSNCKIFDNKTCVLWPKSRFIQIKAFFDRCGIHLRHLKFSGWSPETVLSFIRMAPNVKHLQFYDVRLNDEYLKELAQIVPHLKSLHFKSSLPFYKSDSDYGVMEYFKVMTCLEYLHISENSSTYSNFLNQRSFVQFPPNLKFLSLNHLTNTSQILNWVAKGCKDIKALSVSKTFKLIENGFKAISQMKSLTYLDVAIHKDDNYEFGNIFEALTELRALEITSVNEKAITAVARYCKKLEHLSLNCIDKISPGQHTNILRVASLPNLCSLDMWIESYSKEQLTELVNCLIGNDKLQYVRLEISKAPLKTSAPLESEILFQMLRHCKSIRSIALNFGQIDYSDLYSTICHVVDKIDESERQQCKFLGAEHTIVEVQYKREHDEENLPSQYKWLRFKDYTTYKPNAITEKWQYGWLSAEKPEWA